MRDLFNKAIAAHQGGQLEQAGRWYEEVLSLEPRHFDALHLSGVLLYQQGDGASGAARVEQALQLNPGSADALCNLGTIRAATGDFPAAIAAFEKALQAEPALFKAHNNLGNLYLQTGNLPAAARAYEAALQLQPGYAQGHYNLAHCYMSAGRRPAAIDACRKALQLEPRQVAFHGFLGSLLESDQQPARAIEAYRQGLKLAPRDPELHYHLGFCLEAGGDLTGAREHYRRALDANGRHGGALSALLFVKRKLGDWQDLDVLDHRLFKAIERGDRDITPFSLLMEPGTPALQLRCAQLWAAQIEERVALIKRQCQFDFHREKRDRITVGYLSADYYQHPTAWLAARLFELHDRKRFRVIAYSNSRDDGSAMRKRLEAAFDEFVDIRDLSLQQAAEKIHRDGVDILVDLKGYTLEANNEIPALRPAPIQVNYLGYPGTMGASFMDYIIVDPQVVKTEEQRFYTEKLVQMPNSYQINDAHREFSPKTPSRAELGLPESGFVFACLNNNFKITPPIFRAWMRILEAVPDSVLLLLARTSDQALVSNFREQAGKLGIDPARLCFVGPKPYADYLAQYRQVDLFLDTVPYNAHTTASDALWEACPVLTLTGETFPSRVGASLLHAVACPELVTDNLEEYVRRAVELAGAPGPLQEIRQRLKDNRKSCALFDSERFTRDLERAFEAMMENWLAGKAPQAIVLDRA